MLIPKRNAPTAGNGRGAQIEYLNGVNSEGPGPAEQALLFIEGEEYGAEYLKRLKAGTAGPDELATLTAFMHSGPMLAGFTKVIRKAIAQPGDRESDFEALAARARSAGYSLQPVDIDGTPCFIVSRWGWSRTIGSLAGVAKFLAHVGVTA